jgi:predicted GNAT family acetyltransferase
MHATRGARRQVQPGTGVVRPLMPGEVPAALGLLARTPAASALVTSRLYEVGLNVQRLESEVLAYVVDGHIQSMCHVGANVIPVAADTRALQAFADAMPERPEHAAAVVGPADQVLPLWSLLEPRWGPPREIRPRQPLMSMFGDVQVDPDPAVRPVRMDQIDQFMPAAVRMFTEEVGTSPTAGDGGLAYRARVAQLITQGRAYARFDGADVVFKAEVGAVAPAICLLQGVYVSPDHRGEGLASHGVAAVVQQARREHAPDVALYVNDYNTRAVSAYRSVGFADVGCFATVMLPS